MDLLANISQTFNNQLNELAKKMADQHQVLLQLFQPTPTQNSCGNINNITTLEAIPIYNNNITKPAVCNNNNFSNQIYIPESNVDLSTRCDTAEIVHISHIKVPMIMLIS